ncbi:hypothetical protein [Streptomyces botrytidirepellens]|nr:hypothetical protein [Streptomyces botrytidirepellens]
MTPISTTPAHARNRHDDAPDTAADFERMAADPQHRGIPAVA